MAKAKALPTAIVKPGKPSVTNTKRSQLSQLCDILEAAAAGLTHTSESDYPYRFFTLTPPALPPEDGKLSTITFLNSIGLSEELLNEFKVPIAEFVQEKPFDNFLPNIQDIANYHGLDINDKKVVAESKRYRNLEKIIQKRLRDVRVFRVGKIDVRCYIAGFTKQGDIAGLVTTAIET